MFTWWLQEPLDIRSVYKHFFGQLGPEFCDVVPNFYNPDLITSVADPNPNINSNPR
jgi:hypothetical protein